MRLLGPCGFASPSPATRCDACQRRIRCVYTVDDGGWLFYLGRRCYERLMVFLSPDATPDPEGET